jgi:outer membrane protein assembly factor BamD (BamD/ComL family)
MSVFILSALVSLYYTQYQLAAIAGFLFCFVLWSHFKHSSILLASKYFKDADYERTEKILDEVKSPDRLARNRRGYYEFMRANIALKKEDFETAEIHFQIASRFPLGTQNDKAFVMIHLANLALRKKDGKRAKTYIERAKELAVTSRAKEIIKTIEKEADRLA